MTVVVTPLLRAGYPMIELRALGGFAVRDRTTGETRDLPLAPRQAALLAYVALARPRGPVARDRLLGVFWPELPEDRARAALRQALYRLRVELGREVVISIGETHVEVIRDRVLCDAVMFDEAFGEGRLDTALDLYGGDLVDGFFVGDAPEFERWLDHERDRYRRQAVEAATKLAQRDEDAGNRAGAANHLRRALALAPYDEAVARELVRLLFAIGDRSGAIHAWEIFAARIARDLELEPSPALRTFVESLRNAEPPAPEWTGDFAVSADERAMAEPAAAAVPIPEERTASPAPRPHRWPGSAIRRIAMTLAGAAVLGAVMLQCFGESVVDPASVASPEDLRPGRVLVLPLQNRTQDPAVATIGKMAADWITQSLQRSGLVEVIDANTAFRLLADVQPAADGDAQVPDALDVPQLRSVAEGARAGVLVWGSVSRRNGGLEFHVQVTNARDGTVLRVLEPVVADPADAGPALEALRSRVTGALASVVDERLATVVAPSSAPPTFEAYQEYVQGMELFAPGTYAEAAVHFARAAQLDTTFITARFWQAYSVANSSWRGPPLPPDSLIFAMEPLRDRLPPAERAGLDAFLAEVRGDWEGALRSHRQAARLAPQSNWVYMAAVWAKRLGRPREALASLAVLDPSRGWLRGWPGYWEVRLQAHQMLGEHEQQLAAVRLAKQILPVPLHIHVVHHELEALAALGRLREFDRLLDSLVQNHLANGWETEAVYEYRLAGLELRAHGHRTESRRYFQRCLELRLDGPHVVRVADDAVSPSMPRGYRPECMYDAGRYADTWAYWRSGADSLARAHTAGATGGPTPALFLFQGARSAARLGLRDEVERIIAGATTQTLGWSLPAAEAYLHWDLAKIAALLGQTDRAVQLIREWARQEPNRANTWAYLHLFLYGDLDSVRDALLDDPVIAPLISPSK